MTRVIVNGFGFYSLSTRGNWAAATHACKRGTAAFVTWRGCLARYITPSNTCMGKSNPEEQSSIELKQCSNSFALPRKQQSKWAKEGNQAGICRAGLARERHKETTNRQRSLVVQKGGTRFAHTPRSDMGEDKPTVLLQAIEEKYINQILQANARRIYCSSTKQTEVAACVEAQNVWKRR